MARHAAVQLDDEIDRLALAGKRLEELGGEPSHRKRGARGVEVRGQIWQERAVREGHPVGLGVEREVEWIDRADVHCQLDVHRQLWEPGVLPGH